MREIIEVGSLCQERFFCQRDYSEFKTMGIFVAGLSSLRESYHVRRRFSQWAMLSATIEGEGHLRVGDQVHQLKAGSLCYIPPCTQFEFTLNDTGYRKTAWVILNVDNFGIQNFQAWQKHSSLTLQLYHCLESLDFERHASTSSTIRSALIKLLSLNLERIFEHPLAVKDARLQLLVRKLQNDLSKDWCIESMCRIAGLSESQLHRLCQKYFSLSPKKLLMSLRLTKSQHLLRNSELSIVDIAFNVGFSSSSHYSTVFRHKFGLSPRDYRQTPNDEIKESQLL